MAPEVLRLPSHPRHPLRRWDAVAIATGSQKKKSSFSLPPPPGAQHRSWVSALGTVPVPPGREGAAGDAELCRGSEARTKDGGGRVQAGRAHPSQSASPSSPITPRLHTSQNLPDGWVGGLGYFHPNLEQETLALVSITSAGMWGWSRRSAEAMSFNGDLGKGLLAKDKSVLHQQMTCPTGKPGNRSPMAEISTPG